MVKSNTLTYSASWGLVNPPKYCVYSAIWNPNNGHWKLDTHRHFELNLWYFEFRELSSGFQRQTDALSDMWHIWGEMMALVFSQLTLVCKPNARINLPVFYIATRKLAFGSRDLISLQRLYPRFLCRQLWEEPSCAMCAQRILYHHSNSFSLIWSTVIMGHDQYDGQMREYMNTVLQSVVFVGDEKPSSRKVTN